MSSHLRSNPETPPGVETFQGVVIRIFLQKPTRSTTTGLDQTTGRQAILKGGAVCKSAGIGGLASQYEREVKDPVQLGPSIYGGTLKWMVYHEK